ncbi:efflux RND transporter periplasmic adaptor subunit [Buttiauxella agrestis]|uniref:Cobalt/zinc/cadmium efflux RND transporter membrane fusion protein n=1 Tax=Buttiauxella agrestis ATCC 33320 TaxID=1006004 RepID=A0A085GG38_9ENTR|nr:efflux RND transporter periplasmic adaptor subunit [Buttiauxella agrestis]KFC82683.1 cobalt/zinc/cadmium efflux RND transporter membrane fusion protein [Buttiauxella agrestis ATCC 33320]
MKTITKLSLVALAIAGALGAGYYAGKQSHGTLAPAAQSERKVLYWYDPMTPGQRFDKPGKSPFMDMDLVPRYAGEATEEGGVTVSARQQQNLGIKTAQVEKKVLDYQFDAFATVSTDERSVQIIPASANGVVEKLFVNAPQQFVKAGEPLAQLWIPEWTAAQQEYLAVRQLGDSALTSAARERLQLQFMPAEIIRLVEKTGRPQTRVTVRAKQAGYINKLDTREGAQVAATAPLFEIASLESVWIVIDYPQTQAQVLQVGSEIQASSDSWPGETFHGRVSELLPNMETTTRTLKARIVLENSQMKLKPGMYLNVTLANSPALPPVLAIPEEALIETGSASRVLVTQNDGHFNPVNVVVGTAQNGWVEIKQGLKEGDKVVTSGQFLIDSEASLRSALPEEKAASSTAQEYEGEAVVKGIADDAITLSHKPIPALKWSAMTMDFALKSATDAKGIKVGDNVMFSFTMDDENGAAITHLMPMAGAMK